MTDSQLMMLITHFWLISSVFTDKLSPPIMACVFSVITLLIIIAERHDAAKGPVV